MILRVIFFAGALFIAFWLMVRLFQTSRFSFRNKVALITGGSRGLGLAIAGQICEQGGRVAILARDADELARAKAELAARGGDVLPIPCDLLDRTQIQSAVQQTLERFGQIDILINNAGIVEIGPLEHMQREDFEKSMQLHFWAAVELVSQVVPKMWSGGGGRIVNISSLGGKIAVPHMAPYTASKFALAGFSDAIRAELARYKIQVTTVTPGMMRTDSQGHAKFKGDQAAEQKWFEASTKLPFASISAERAARKILVACAQGQPALIMPWPAHFMIAANALFPNLSGYAMKIVNSFLPSSIDVRPDAEIHRAP